MTSNATLHVTLLALAAVAIDAVVAASAVALPVACAKVTDPAHHAAIASAEAWVAARWRPAGGVWTTAFTLKPTPALPLGIGTFGRTQRDGGEPATSLGGPPAAPIAGAARVSRVACTTYEINSDAAGPTYVVRFTGHRLQFDEAASGWSRPLANAVLHVLMVSTPSGSASQVVSDLPESRTALPPDMHLSLPPPPTPGLAARIPATKRR